MTTRLVVPAAAGRRTPTWALAAFSTRTENPVIAEPPVAGAVHLTVTELLEAAVAVPIAGAPGAVAAATGVMVLELAEQAPVPRTLTAATVKWTA